MGNYNVNADYVLRRRRILRKIVASIIGIAILLLLEAVVFYNYLAYLNSVKKPFSGIDLTDFILAAGEPFQHTLPVTVDTVSNIGICMLKAWFIPVLAILFAFLLSNNKGKYKGVEHGSARWMKKEEKKALFKYMPNAIPVADEIYVYPKRNKLKNYNELVIGDSGAGKSFGKLIPDIMQMYGSYIITDVKGALYRQLYKILNQNGYEIRAINLIDVENSNTFNPIPYLKDDTDIDKLVNTFIANSRKPGTQTGDGFWEDSMGFLLAAVLKYLVITPDEEKTFSRAFDLISSLAVFKGQVDPSCEFDQLMLHLETKDPFNMAVLNYRSFKQAPGETLQSIIISTTSRMRLWTNEKIRILTHSDELNIDGLCEKKTALFVIIPDNDSTYNCITSMLFSTILQRLCWLADNKYHGRLPLMVSLEMDEFANIGVVPQFEGYISTIRSRNIRAMIIIQALQQLEKLYKDGYKIIRSNCAIYNYMGTRDIETREDLVKQLGKTTIAEDSTSVTKSGHGGSSESTKGEGRELLTIDELNQIGNKAIVLIDGFYPIYQDKFHTEKHTLFSMLGNDDLSHVNSANNTDIKDIYKDLRAKHEKDYRAYLEKHTATIPNYLDDDMPGEERLQFRSPSSAAAQADAELTNTSVEQDTENIENEMDDFLKNLLEKNK